MLSTPIKQMYPGGVINHGGAVKRDMNSRALPFRCGTVAGLLLSLSLFTEGSHLIIENGAAAATTAPVSMV